MAVDATKTGVVNIEAVEGEDGAVSYVETWQVVTTDRNDGPITVRNAAGVPRRGDTLRYGSDTDTSASCRSRRVRLAAEQDTLRKWHVICEFSTAGSSQDPGGNSSSGDPIDWEWHCDLDTWERMRAPEADRTGRALVGTADEPFVPPPEYDDHDPLINLTKNHPTLNLAAWYNSVGKVNSGVLWGLPRRLVKLKKWMAKPHWVGPGVMYWANSYQVSIKSNGWFYEPPNLGHREVVLDGVGNRIFRAILDDRDIPITSPVPLDALGAKLPPGAATLFFDQAVGAAMARFELEDEYDLSTIFPATLPGNFV